MRRHLDPWSRIVIALTLILFTVALVVKGLGHDILVEAGVFLVSVKLITLAYRTSVANAELEARFDALHATLTRMERALDAVADRRRADEMSDNPLQRSSHGS